MRSPRSLVHVAARFLLRRWDDTPWRRRDNRAESPENRSMLEAAVEGMNDGLAIADTSGKYISMNEAFARLHRLRNKGEYLACLRDDPGNFQLYTLEEAPVPDLDLPIRRALRGEVLTDCELAIKKRDTDETWIISYSCAPIQNGNGEIIAAVATARDTTAQRKAREALSESEGRYYALAEELRAVDRRKNEFLAVLSHELRSPLASIHAGLQILRRAPHDGEQARRVLEILDRQAGQLSRLVDDLLDVARIRQNKIQLQRRRVDLNELVRRTIEDHRPLFEQRGVVLEAEFSPFAVFVQADEIRLAQVVGNLLQNAAKFTEPDGNARVTVAASLTKKRAVIRVADSGAGIPRGMIRWLFQPFMQADAASNRNRGGLGLGLALVKGIVELHGGDVHAYSFGPDRGSEFVVHLPLDDTMAGEPAEVVPAISRRSRRVLIIEDNIDLAQSLSELLELDGHRVTVAYNGPAGLAKAREVRPEVLLCDIGLPEMDGYDVARAFRADEKLKGVFLVAMTGYAQTEDRQRAAAAGFDRHLAKPPDLVELERMLAVATAEE